MSAGSGYVGVVGPSGDVAAALAQAAEDRKSVV